MLEKLDELADQIFGGVLADPEKLRILVTLYSNPFEGTDLPPYIHALGTYGIIPIASAGVAFLLIMVLLIRWIVKRAKAKIKPL